MKHLNMNETFRRWPLGMSTFPAWADLYGPFFHEWRGNAIPFDDWLYERLRPLLEAPGRVEIWSFSEDDWHAIKWPGVETVAACIDWCTNATFGPGYAEPRRRVVLLDGTVIREWPIDDYDGIF